MGKLLYQFLFLLIATEAASKPVCQYGWMPFGKNCYFFSTNLVTHKAARAQCRSHGGQLLELENRGEEIWVRLHSLLRGNIYGVWLGYTDIIQHGRFLALSDAKTPHYTHWYPGEPNNLYGKERCAIYWSKKNGWNDGPCNDKWYYVCKK